jgi:hypothetical protein
MTTASDSTKTARPPEPADAPLPCVPSYHANTEPNEINLLEYVYILARRKWWLIGTTLVGVLIGLIVAHAIGPRYDASVLIAPRETETQNTPSFSGFGELGGLVASQLSFGTTPGLGRIETILGTRQFNAEMIEKYRLLPDLYRTFYPRLYRRWYDAQEDTWKEDFERPGTPALGAFLAAEVVERKTNGSKRTMTIGVSSPDSLFTHRLLSAAVEYLNVYIRDNIQDEAQANVAYLDSMLQRTTDPLLREKVQELIAKEIERMMVVSNRAFQVLDPPVVTASFGTVRRYPAAFGVAAFVLTAVSLVIAHAVSNLGKHPEDQRLLAAIRRELTFGRRSRHK